MILQGHELRIAVSKLQKDGKKQQVIDAMFKRYSTISVESHDDKIAVLRSELVAKNGLSRPTFYRHIKGFHERYIEETGHRDINAATEVLEINRTKDVPMSMFASKLKTHTYRLLAGGDMLAETGITMVTYYCGKIRETIHKAGGIENMKAEHIAKLNIYEDRLEKYYGMVSLFMHPTAISKYLKLIGIEDVVNNVPDDLELGALTPAKLLKQLREVGMKGMFHNDDALLELGAKIEIQNLPVIDAQLVKDEENEEMNNRMREQRKQKKVTLEDLDN